MLADALLPRPVGQNPSTSSGSGRRWRAGDAGLPGELVFSERPGLGLELDQAALERLRVDG